MSDTTFDQKSHDLACEFLSDYDVRGEAQGTFGERDVLENELAREIQKAIEDWLAEAIGVEQISER